MAQKTILKCILPAVAVLVLMATAAPATDISGSNVTGVIHDQIGQPEYAALKEALGRYSQAAARGGWPQIPEGEALRPGDHSPRIPLLRRRLTASGDLQDPAAAGAGRFDDGLKQALARFQRRHGLEASGLLDTPTLAALNVPLAERIRQIEYNLERRRRVPRDLGPRYILVNVADFSLKVVENRRPVLRMRVVVGKSYSRRTPVFSSRVTYLVINPVWTIPPRIAREDVLPRIQADPDYLRERKIHVFASWLPDAPEIDPRTIDWTALGPDRLPYKLQQEPGPQNELGRMKFMFPNRFSVYLHDTPHRDQFSRPQRDFSSGCIRLEKPVDLATCLLKDSPGWTREKIMATIDNGREMVIGLKTPIAIHLFYWTAWVDENGELQFRKDIYGRDTSMRQALEKRPAAEGVTTAGRDRYPYVQNRFEGNIRPRRP